MHVFFYVFRCYFLKKRYMKTWLVHFFSFFLFFIVASCFFQYKATKSHSTYLTGIVNVSRTWTMTIFYLILPLKTFSQWGVQTPHHPTHVWNSDHPNVGLNSVQIVWSMNSLIEIFFKLWYNSSSSLYQSLKNISNNLNDNKTAKVNTILMEHLFS